MIQPAILRLNGIALLMVLLLVPVTGFAQEDPDNVIDDEIEENIDGPTPDEDEEVRKDGWTYGLSLGASISLSHSENVVGATNGLTLQLGGLLDAFVNLIAGNHEWQTTLKIEHAQTKTPQIEGFLKSVDNLVLSSIYLYRFDFAQWFGLFGRARLETSIFPAVDRRSEEVTIVKTDVDGNSTSEVVPAQDDIDLTDFFEPLVITETAGAFAEPIARKFLTANIKLGLGGQHIITRDGYTIDDDEDTPEIELTQLQSSNSFGGEFEVDLKGHAADNISWGFIANLFYPFVSSADTDLEGAELLHITLSGKVSVKLAQWLSLDYSLSAKKLPFIVDVWQVQNIVLFTAGFDIF